MISSPRCCWFLSATAAITAYLLSTTAAAAFSLVLRPTQASSLHTTARSSATNLDEPENTADTVCTKNDDDPTMTTTTTTSLRSVRKILPPTNRHWVGDGFHVYPVFANAAFTEEVSPLLMFDYAAPKQFPAKQLGHPLGVGQHPHRGFETVTVAFQGEVEHKDSTGVTDVIGQGDVQWMTAGRGIIHQEFHSNKFTKEGGTFEMCQLWVNLPKQHKMTKPKYQALLNKDIPVVNLPLDAPDDDAMAQARIIAGALGETPGAASTFSPVQMWDVTLPHAGAEVDVPYPPEHQLMVFVRRGSVDIISTNDRDDKLKSSSLGPQDVAMMRMDGAGTVRFRVNEPDSSIMILGGEPIDEPIAAQGPFVMNTHDEIRKAITDYQMGKFGK